MELCVLAWQALLQALLQLLLLLPLQVSLLLPMRHWLQCVYGVPLHQLPKYLLVLEAWKAVPVADLVELS